MLDARLPVHIDPLRLAQQRREISGRYRLAEFSRLGEALVDDDGEVTVELHFGIDEQGIPYMQGRLRAQLQLRCQRCLEPMPYAVDSELSLGIVEDEVQAEALPSHYEPLFAEQEPLYLADVIEDELLLALPIVPRHDPAECAVDTSVSVGGDAQEEVEQDEPTEKENPFAALSAIKSKSTK